ncbi:unnamed protein product [Brachionus calyciflorus]|uniref:Uncharacterized protein n=1 Tax=Brachionus calyciflorus TaxID=104777 RepID=A0A813YSW3_9BILA|nr:unnamed protein product [Brachionus calyciflorus]
MSFKLGDHSELSESIPQIQTHIYKFYNRPKPQPNKCICGNDKLYNCTYCTSNYPISVRRSKDGEEDNCVLCNCGKNNNDQKNDVNASFSRKHQNFVLKPSPFPVSSHLLELMTLTNPSCKFTPPPNKSLK